MDFVFANSDFLVDEPGAYPGWPQATAALAVSDAIHTFLERACHPGFPLHNVPVQIEDWFQPAEKEKRIALMPRRRREDLLGAVQLVRRSGRLGDWEIVLIDGMTQQQVAEELGRAAIYLFGAEREGVGLPGAEAMASGCYVVGFTGDGAKEYMRPEHASVIADSDVVGMCERTLEAMDWFDNDRELFDSRAEAGRAWVRARHSADLVRKRLGAAFDEITSPESPSRMPATVTLPHYQAHAPSTDLWNKARIAARRTGRNALNKLIDRR
jgi:glycosyltransferase involved in cell wall biosynthesis